MLLGIILAGCSYPKAGRNKRNYVLARKEVEEEYGIHGHEGVRCKVLDWMVQWESVERRTARCGSDVPDVRYGHQLRDLSGGDNRAKKFRKPESVVRVHEKVDKSVHEHAAALSTGIIHDIQEQEKCGGVVIQVQKANF
jgi:hypothetical protein